MNIKEMIDYFKGVQAQHKVASKLGYTNPNSEPIIKTYDFVIKTLEEWENNPYCDLCGDETHNEIEH